MAATIGFYLSGVIAIAIIFIGCRFLLAPATAAAAYGVPAGVEPHWRAYLSAKGIRDMTKTGRTGFRQTMDGHPFRGSGRLPRRYN